MLPDAQCVHARGALGCNKSASGAVTAAGTLHAHDDAGAGGGTEAASLSA